MRTKLFTAIVILAAASQMAATGGDGCGPGVVIQDPGFDLWCGDVLCSWKLVSAEGSIRKAPTWHDKDAGVEFLGSDAIIEQVSPVDSGDGSCIKFELLADVDDKAEMHLGIDIYGDGTVDRDERIPTSDWRPLTYLIKLDGSYRGIRFVLEKHGTGKAVLAQIAATIASRQDCSGFDAIVAAPAPNGAWCDDDGDCASGMCRVTLAPELPFDFIEACVGCDPMAPACGAGEVCGTFEPTSFIQSIVPACTPEASDEVGERCRVGTECGSGICNAGVCSTCDTAHPCESGSCRLAYANGPTTCTGGARGEPCAIDTDCTSGRCEGATRSQCADGRSCQSPANCPVEEDLTLEPGACTLVGVQGGSCF